MPMPSLLAPEAVEKEYFETTEGRRLYVPAGTRTMISRRTYLVPDGGTHQRIVAVRRRLGYRNTVDSLAWLGLGMATGAQVVGWTIGPGSPVDPTVPATLWVVVLTALVFAVPHIAASIAMREIGPLERGPDRSSRAALAASDADIGRTGNLWALAAIGIATLAWFLRESYDMHAEGKVAQALIFGSFGSIVGIVIVGVSASMLRMRKLRAENARLERVVAERTQELRELTRTLEARVQEQVAYIDRLGQLKHFFAAPVAEMILKEERFDPSKVHRREISVVSVDLRGFTAFSETAEPEEVIAVLRAYHAELGIQVNRTQATLEHFSGENVMLFLNDPVEIADHPMRAVELADGIRAAMRPHLEEWRSHGFDIGLGIGIAAGYATIGVVGYEGRWEYASIGMVCNLAARLCAEAKDGQVVVSKRFVARLGERADVEALGERTLKGLSRPVAAFNVAGLKAAAQVPA